MTVQICPHYESVIKRLEDLEYFEKASMKNQPKIAERIVQTEDNYKRSLERIIVLEKESKIQTDILIAIEKMNGNISRLVDGHAGHEDRLNEIEKAPRVYWRQVVSTIIALGIGYVANGVLGG